MILEIILIVVGIAAIVAGYVIPAAKDKNTEAEEFSREQVKSMVGEEVEAARSQISDIVDETITYAMEKTERSMDRLSNEKMMAVNEYSDTVLEQINKNHEEAVFLYDMLNDKHENLKDTVAEAEKKAAEVKETINRAEDLKTAPVVAKTDLNAEKPASEVNIMYEEAPVRLKPSPKKTPRKNKKDEAVIPEVKFTDPEPEVFPEVKESVSPAYVDEKDEEQDQEEIWDDFNSDDDEEDDFDGPDISFDSRTPGSRNSNERILALHKEGKSNMAIAKELGLGVGEVKLVLDLFKGM